MSKQLGKQFIACIAAMVSVIATYGQCTTANLNWDYLDFMAPTIVSLAQSQTQKFAIGTQSVTVTHNYSGTNIGGENQAHTGDASSYGTGADVQFTGDGTITYTFQNAVSNVRFSVYDIDYNQRITVTASNGASPVNITMARVGTALTITGSGTTSASATGPSATAIASSSSDGTANIDITGPVTSIIITVTLTAVKTNGPASGQEDGSFWLSDMQVCSVGTFTNNYRAVAQPLPGMPSYVLTVRNSTVYYTDPATGRCHVLFTDPGHTNINSLAYDPVTKMVYYTYSLTSSPSTDYILRRYDYEMDTFGIVCSDVRTLGLVLHDNGVESGSASFYDGSLYLGIEGNGAGYTTGRASRVWKIDFSGANLPVSASQIFAIDGNNHDWGDIGVSNGVLYDFDADAGNENLIAVNLQTRAGTEPPTLVAKPRQTSIDWQENIYSIGNTGSSPSTGSIALYNTSAGTQGTANTLTYYAASPSGSWGDGADAFKPKTDYGDAPASFDPGATPATHNKEANLRLGATEDLENTKTASANATADGSDEDGILSTLTIASGVTSFAFDVSVFNNTGVAATLVGWVDLNNDGVFQSSEGRTVTVNSSASQQTVSIGWSSVNVLANVGNTIFLRLRLTTAAITTSNSTGYFYDGEVEDYPVAISAVLPGSTEFGVKKNTEKEVRISWKSNASNIRYYTLQHSADATSWSDLMEVDAAMLQNGQYTTFDRNPVKPQTFYRLLSKGINGTVSISNIERVDFSLKNSVSLKPNPASTSTILQLTSIITGDAFVIVEDMTGKQVKKEQVAVTAGFNSIRLNNLEILKSGMYNVKIVMGGEQIRTNLIIVK